MKRAYRRPELSQYGRIDEVTLGATGNKPDAICSGDPLVCTVNPTNPTCTNNVGSGYCYTL